MFSIFRETLGHPRGVVFTIFVIKRNSGTPQGRSIYYFCNYFFLDMNLTSFTKKLSTRSFHLVTRNTLMKNRGNCHLNGIFLLNIQIIHYVTRHHLLYLQQLVMILGGGRRLNSCLLT